MNEGESLTTPEIIHNAWNKSFLIVDSFFLLLWCMKREGEEKFISTFL